VSDEARDQKLTRCARWKDKDGGAIGSQSGVDGHAMLNLCGATAEPAHNSFGGIVIESDPSNHTELRNRPPEAAAGPDIVTEKKKVTKAFRINLTPPAGLIRLSRFCFQTHRRTGCRCSFGKWHVFSHISGKIVRMQILTRLVVLCGRQDA